jgi:hypothetical protein
MPLKEPEEAVEQRRLAPAVAVQVVDGGVFHRLRRGQDQCACRPATLLAFSLHSPCILPALVSSFYPCHLKINVRADQRTLASLLVSSLCCYYSFLLFPRTRLMCVWTRFLACSLLLFHQSVLVTLCCILIILSPFFFDSFIL